MDMKILLDVIPHSEQRYPTPGDYFKEDGMWKIVASELPNPDHSFLIQLHELIELYLTQKRGIEEPDIMAFDLQYEKERNVGDHSEEEEPGDDPRAPYYREHQYASAVEYLMAVALDVDRNDYDNAVLELLNPT
jgi:hypothetical protein